MFCYPDFSEESVSKFQNLVEAASSKDYRTPDAIMLGRTLKAIPTAITRHMTTSISATAPGLAAAAASTATSTATPASAPTYSTHSRHSLVPVFHDLAQLRRWRRHARERGSVGVVPTMGALHDGHLELGELLEHRLDEVE